MRSAKYLNAREYAERLRLSDNKDIQDFADEFLEALDDRDDSEFNELKEAIDEAAENAPEGTRLEDIKWLGQEANTLAEIEEAILNACPEYAALIDSAGILDAITDMIKRLRPIQEYDL